MTPVAACRNHHSCLARRDEIFRQDAIWVRDHECVGCTIGTARRMMNFTPEPDVEPIPLRNTGKPPAPPPTCTDCGKPCCRGAMRCKKCWGLARRINHDKCSVKGCRWLARRAGLCQSHYHAKKQADTKAYREKAHAIAEYRAQVPKQRVVE